MATRFQQRWRDSKRRVQRRKLAEMSLGASATGPSTAQITLRLGLVAFVGAIAGGLSAPHIERAVRVAGEHLPSLHELAAFNRDPMRFISPNFYPNCRVAHSRGAFRI